MATSDSPPMTPNVTLSAAVAKDVVPPAPGEPSISSVTDNGSTLTIAGSDFGSKAQAAPLLHDIGGNAWENGVLNTFYADQPDGTRPSIDLTYPNPNAPYVTFAADAGSYTGGSAIAKIDKASTLRSAAQACNYFFAGSKARLGTPTIYQSGSDSERKLYWASWVKYKWTWTISPVSTDSVSGTFVIDEEVTINGENVGATYLGYYAEKDDHFIHKSGLNTISSGDVIVGVTSGASFTVTGRLFSGSKISRVRSDYNIGADADNLIASDSFDSFYISPTAIAENTVAEKSIIAQEMTDWALVEYEIEYFPETETAKWRNWWNGRLRGEITADVSGRGDIYGMTISLWGLDSSDRAWPQEMTVAENYMDNSFQRVYLGNAATWSEVTQRELQRPTAWSDTGITVDKNFGTLTGTKWAYVVGPDGLINENGVQA